MPAELVRLNRASGGWCHLHHGPPEASPETRCLTRVNAMKADYDPGLIDERGLVIQVLNAPGFTAEEEAGLIGAVRPDSAF